MVIVQLSDIHIKNNEMEKKVCCLTNAIASECRIDKKCYILVTGDITNMGKETEFNIALNFFSLIKEHLNNESIEVEYIMVPGNHDCYLDTNSSEYKIRKILLESNKIDMKDRDFQDKCIYPLNSFYDFNELITERKVINKFVDVYEVVENNLKLSFISINTSWMTDIKENKSKYFPIEFFDLEVESDISIALFHHPYSWFLTGKDKEFKDKVEETADLIFTGHEHQGDTYTKIDIDNERKIYFEGESLNPHNDSVYSGFKIVKIDLTNKKYLTSQYEFSNNMYKVKHRGTWSKIPLHLNKKFHLSEEFLNFINDMDVRYLYKDRMNINLDELYIWPWIEKQYADDKNAKSEMIKDKDGYIKEILKVKRSLIIGANSSGKTALAKRLYNELYTMTKLLPLYIEIDNFKGTNEVEIEKSLKKIFNKQYKGCDFEEYRQLPIKNKVFIIDNFSLVSHQRQRLHVLQVLESFSDNIIVFGDENTEYNVILSNVKDCSLRNYKQYSIAEFGHTLRRKLIKKWVELDITNEFEMENVEVRINKLENELNNIIGNNYIPKYPIFLLTILSELDVLREDSGNISTYAYLYESLITRWLIKAIRGRNNLDTIYTYLSVLAYQVFLTNIEVLNIDFLKTCHNIYEKTYNKEINFDKILDDLVSGQILYKKGASYSFKYKYLYYYFVARYFRDNITDPDYEKDIKDTVRYMCNNLYINKFADIILFMCHFKMDIFVLSEIITNAKSVLYDIEFMKLEDDVVLINTLTNKENVLFIKKEDSDAEKNREEIYEAQDELESKAIIEESEFEVVDNGELSPVMELNKGIKLIDILGQIARNYEGSLKTDKKYEVVYEGFTLGLRILNFLVKFVFDNKEKLIDLIGNNIEYVGIDERNEMVYSFINFLSLSFIFKISDSFGKEELSNTYKDILKNNNCISFNLIDVSAKLEKFSGFPEREILSLFDKINNNNLALSVLRNLVIRHFYLYNRNRQLKQSIYTKLRISYNASLIQETKNKELDIEY